MNRDIFAGRRLLQNDGITTNGASLERVVLIDQKKEAQRLKYVGTYLLE